MENTKIGRDKAEVCVVLPCMALDWVSSCGQAAFVRADWCNAAWFP